MSYIPEISPSHHPRAGRAIVRALVLLASCAALTLTANSCRENPMSPAGASATVLATPGLDGQARVFDPSDPPTPEESQVPLLSLVRGQVRGDSLVIQGRLVARTRKHSPNYDPYHAGGWALQLFTDTDPASNPYWLGYEHLVRGVEWDAGHGTMVTRAITFEDQYPGGWGPETGQASFRLTRLGFVLAVPLSSIGGSPAGVNFALETYATVECSECGGGVTQQFVDDYFGTARSVGAGYAQRGIGRGNGRSHEMIANAAAVDLRLAVRR